MSHRVPRAVALLGDPVDHSLSPAIHEAAFGALDLNARYVAVRTLEPELPGLLRAFARSGGGNVTVPHKVAARELVDRATGAARRTGACNCFWTDGDGAIHGDNTDVEGFRLAMEAWEEAPPLEGAGVLLLGAGGAARAVATACVDAGVERLEIRNRTHSRARDLAERLGGQDAGVTARELGEGPGRAGTDGGPYDLVVNATSLGLGPDDPLPVDLGRTAARAAFDLVYGPDGTPWTRHAREEGVPSVDGLEMLVRQAGLSLRRWFDVEPPLEVMRSAARRSLGG